MKKVTMLPHELFEKLQSFGGQQQRIDFLGEKDYDEFVVKTILQLAYNEKIELELPKGTPPFAADPGDVGLQPTALKNTIRKLGQLVKSNKNFPPIKKEKTFIGILESIHPKDAEILVAAKDKRLHKVYPKVSENLVEKVWPNLLK